jgi:hypothetical protein
VGNRESRFVDEIAPGAWIGVRWRWDDEKEMDWAAVLLVEQCGQRRPVCLYDNAHGQPERHRYRDGVKLEAEPVSPRRLPRHDLPAAIAEIKASWESMVRQWER